MLKLKGNIIISSQQQLPKQLPAPPPLASAFRADSCSGSCAGRNGICCPNEKVDPFLSVPNTGSGVVWNALRVFGIPGPITLFHQALWPSYPNPIQARWIFVCFFRMVSNFVSDLSSPKRILCHHLVIDCQDKALLANHSPRAKLISIWAFAARRLPLQCCHCSGARHQAQEKQLQCQWRRNANQRRKGPKPQTSKICKLVLAGFGRLGFAFMRR